MPEGLQQRYVARLRSAESNQIRRWRMIAGAAAAGILLVGSISFYLIRGWARSSDASQAASTIFDMIELGQVEQASGFLEKLEKADAGLLAYPPMIDARGRLKAVQDKETERAVQFDKTLRAAEHSPLNQLNPPELVAARKLARQQTEKQAIDQLLQRRAAALAAERANREKDVGPRLDAVGRKIAEVQQKVQAGVADQTGGAEILVPLGEAQRELADLGPAILYVGDDLQSRATVLAQRIDEHARTARQTAAADTPRGGNHGRSCLFGRKCYGQLGEIRRQAGWLHQIVSGRPPRQAFKHTVGERALWDDVEAWNQLVEGWKDEPAGAAPRDPKLRAEQCSRFLPQHTGMPDAAEIALYQKHLEAIDHRSLGADDATAKIQRLFADILVENLWMIKVKVADTRFNCYYLTSQPDDSTVLVKHLIGFDAKERRTPIVKAMIVSSDWSPQTKIATKFKSILVQESTRSDWEKVMIRLASEIRTEPEIDPVLQVALLRNVLELAAEGSVPLREELTTTRGVLEQGDVNVNVPWMNPEDPDAAKMRPKAAHVVQILPDFADVLTRALARRDKIERQVKRLPRSVGWLAHEKEGWLVRTGSVMPAAGDLWVVALPEDKRGRWKKIGTISGGKPRLSGEDNAAMAEGRPVFVMTYPTD